MIVKWATHSRLGSPSASVTQTSSNGLLYYTELSPPRQQRVEIKRGLCATYWIDIRDQAIGDVMWCRTDDRTADSAGLETRNQTPDPPASTLNHIMSNFPLILNESMHTRHTHTHISHRHNCLPPELLTPGKNIAAHHASMSTLPRNLTPCAKWALPQMIPHVTSSAEKLTPHSASTLPYNQAAVTLLKTQGWKSNNCTLWWDFIWVSVNEANANWHSLSKKIEIHTLSLACFCSTKTLLLLNVGRSAACFHTDTVLNKYIQVVFLLWLLAILLSTARLSADETSR